MKKILYLTVQNVNYKAKYNSQINAWQEFGYTAKYYNCNRSIGNILKLNRIIRDYDIVYARHDFGLDCIWPWLKFMLRDRILILEIPTPIDVYLKEVRKYNQSRLKNKVTIFITLFCLKQIAKKSSLIIEYANENNQLILNYSDKIYKWQNGINLSEIYGVSNQYFRYQNLQITNFKQNKEFKLIAVVNLAFYHGLDRLIHGLYNYYMVPGNTVYKVTLTIFSRETKELEKIKKMVIDYHLEHIVKFYGYTKMEELSIHYSQANFAIGSLGDFRKDLKEASSIKMREYAFFGLPACIDHYDQDFSTTGYVIEIPQNENAVDLHEVIKFYNHLVERYDIELTANIHDYAINHCLWKHKVSNLIDESIIRGIL